MSWRFLLLFCFVVGVCGAYVGIADEGGTVPTPDAAQDDPFASGGATNDPFDGGDEDPFGGTGEDPFGAGVSEANDPFSPTPSKPTKRNVPARPATPRPPEKHTPPVKAQPSAESYTRSYPSLTLESKMQRAARARIQQALASETQFEYLEETLADVVDDISYRHELPVVVDKVALEDFGIGTDTPITMSVKGISLRSALTLMLKELDLTFMIADEVLHITTPETAESRVITRFYQVGELLPEEDTDYSDDDSKTRGDIIVGLILTLVEPDTWDEVGGPGSIQFVKHLDTLAISQTEDVLVKVDYLLATLQEIVDARKNGP